MQIASDCLVLLEYIFLIVIVFCVCVVTYALTLFSGLMFGMKEAQAKAAVSQNCLDVLLHASK